ncbi:ligase-associated DNA damage response exonuclease [Mucilaginibacter boryungensis]|uniref:Ligase-associated DNA damage response exonuclease n=1 Tax=Mucilaginibacter boryungensis TaxID=768480 RepID=A0ABR9XMM6_9SPHI|nr:ligase-associated DNA damage response exonuclease [Mucilaginibacter boryungensis]MBE9668314.1 ligase-associated DNA damage response exonuclease [Mucilaginibacter boryungensis]
MKKPLLEFTDRGIYCDKGKFYIDPWKPVDDAVITHAHADHAYWGHKRYLAHHLSREVLYYRLGEINLQTIEYGETITKNGVEVTLFPAGHVIGSAQVRVVSQGEAWVVSGDYKVEDDGVCTPFESVPCHHFISECTFGMPVYKWKPQLQVFNEVNSWWRHNVEHNLATVIVGYSLGKAQRILQNLDLTIGKVYTHGVIENTCEALRRNGVVLHPTERIIPESNKEEVRKGIIIAPPSSVGTPWMRKFQPYSFGYCSGWMAIRGAKRRRAADRGFVLSDHADWDGLISAIDATGCEKVYLTHGYTASFSRYLNTIGFDAHEVHTLYGAEEEELIEQAGDITA